MSMFPIAEARLGMNVYSIRLIPSLKLKFCQFLGIASVMAIDELSDRLLRLEQKLDRLDGQLRRSVRRSLVIPPMMAAPLKKKSPKRRKATLAPALPKKPRLVEVAELKRAQPVLEGVPVPSPEPLMAVIPEVVESPALTEAVVLIQAEEGVRRVAQDYFGAEVRLIDLPDTQKLSSSFEQQRVLAVIFDRALLSEAAVREALEALSQKFPETKIIGLSSYLTLAFAESMPKREDFATFLTRPLSLEALAGVFQHGVKQAIS